MEMAWAEFNPVASFGGGAMIGVAALFLMLLNGRIMGMSSILSGLLVKLPDWPWQLLIGSAIFGIGWGLAGYCPVPVVVSLLLQPAEMLPFLVTLLAGAFIARWLRS